jgi:nickel/cobalt exporter
MKKRFTWLLSLTIGLILSHLLLAPAPALAQDVRPITWTDLQQQAPVEFDDPFAALSEEQLYELSQIARYRLLRQQGKAASNAPSATELRHLDSLQSQGIDVDWLLSQRERVKQARQQQMSAPTAISGERVEISGYALPLTQARQRMTAFLLVPWVGACIHSPPPPANQMIHVAVPQGVAVTDRFTPVTISGVLEHSLDRYRLSLVDGSRDLDVTYTLTAETFADYVPGSDDPLSQVTIPAEALAGQHVWQRWQAQVSALFTTTMADINGQPFSWAFGVGLLVAFLYGVVHTLGPGHGKAVIVSYFVGEGGSLHRGVWMGIRIAVLHVLAAVVLAISTQFIVQQVGGSEASSFRTMRLLSYGAIAGIGGWMVWQAWQAYRRPHRSPIASTAPDSRQAIAHNTLYPSLSQAVLERPTAPVVSNPDSGWGCRCLNCFSSARTGGWLAMAIGAVPCSGALIVLLYGLANNMLGISIALVVAISIGMAIALSTIGILAILGRQTIDRQFKNRARQQAIAAGLRFVGAVLVFMVGSSLFMLTLTSTVA